MLGSTMLEVKRVSDFGAWDVGAMRFKGRQSTQMAERRNQS